MQPKCACNLTPETKQFADISMPWKMKGQSDIKNNTHKIQEWDI